MRGPLDRNGPTPLLRRSFLTALSGAGGALLFGSAGGGTSSGCNRGSGFRPEYARRFEEVLIVYDQVALPFYLNEVLEILNCLPAKRKVYVLVSERREKEARRNLNIPGLDARFVVVPGAYLWGDWGRDIFFAGWRRGEAVLFVPYTKTAETRGRLTRGYEVLRALQDEAHKVVLVPLAFEGGNMAYDCADGKRVLFVGTSVLVESDSLYRRWFGRSLGTKACLSILKRFFEVDRVVPLGRFKDGKPLRQSSFFFHIDLACVILQEGVAGVERFEVPSDTKALRKEIASELRFEAEMRRKEGRILIEKALRERIKESVFFEYRRLQEAHAELEAVRGTFRSMGYRIIDLPTDWRRVRRTQSYTNVLVGEDRLIMPIFPKPGSARVRTRMSGGREVVEVLKPPAPEDYALEGPNLQNYKIYRSLFGDVRVIRDCFYLAGGNIHCVIGSLG